MDLTDAQKEILRPVLPPPLAGADLQDGHEGSSQRDPPRTTYWLCQEPAAPGLLHFPKPSGYDV